MRLGISLLNSTSIKIKKIDTADKYYKKKILYDGTLKNDPKNDFLTRLD